MTDIFISYSRKDQDFVRELHEAIEKSGWDAWVDWENIPLTAEWLQEIYDGIEASDAFAYVISPDSVRSEVCSLELTHALDHNKRLIPILRRELVEDLDKYALNKDISSHNWIFFRESDDFDTAYQKLDDALRTDLSHVRLHTRLLVRSVEWNNRERDTSLVLRGSELREAVHWLDQSTDKEPEATELHREYISASQRAAAARRRVTISVTVYALVVLVLAVFAFTQALNAENRRREADDQRAIAEDQREIARANEATAIAAEATAIYNGEQAQSLALASNASQALLRDNDPELAIALALAANDMTDPPPLAQSALAQAAYYPGTRYIVNDVVNYPTRIAISPVEQQMVAPVPDGYLVLWDMVSGEEIFRWQDTPESFYYSLTFNPDGEHIAASLDDGTVVILSTETQDEVARFKAEPVIDPETEEALSTEIWRMTFTPDGEYLLTGGEDRLVHIWDWQNQTEVGTFDGHTNAIYGIDVSADSTQVVSGDQDGVLYHWELESGDILHEINPEIGSVWTTAITPDGTGTLAGYEDNSLRLWDLESGREIYRFSGHTSRVWDIEISDSGREALSSSYDASLILWDLATGNMIQRFTGHSSAIYGVATGPDDRRAASISADRTIRVWDIQNGAEQTRFQQHSDWLWSLTPYVTEDDETWMLSAGRDGILILWNLDTGETIRQFEGQASEIYSADISRDGSRILSGARDGSVILWDTATGEEITRLEGHGDRVRSVALSPDNTTAASAGDEGFIIIWDLETGEELARLEDHDTRVWDVSYNSDGSQLVSASVDQTAIIRDMTDYSRTTTLTGHTAVVYSAVFSPDDRQVLTGSEDRSLRLWDVETGEQIGRLDGHLQDVNSVAFNAEGTRAVSGSDDRSVRLWDLENRTEIKRFDGHTDEVQAVIFHPNAEQVISGAKDTTIRAWQIMTLEELIAWTDDNRYVPALTCEQRDLYRIEPYCDATASLPDNE